MRLLKFPVCGSVDCFPKLHVYECVLSRSRPTGEAGAQAGPTLHQHPHAAGMGASAGRKAHFQLHPCVGGREGG